jgi:5-methylcytosine-specific restriction endonuclease McrBC GTP-binding regulatory subunit McrB
MENSDKMGQENMELQDYMKIMDSLEIHQMILQGPPGTSKTYRAKKFIAEKLNVKKIIGGENEKAEIKDALEANTDYWKMVQFHPSYGYEDFVRGITVTTGGDEEGNSIRYETINKIFGELCEQAAKETAKKYFLLIDEINRADVSTVFGELIYALEYRGEEVNTPYKPDKQSDENNKNNEDNKGYEIKVPDNLYIIGTMNTADKSVSNIDYAIRRRFLFFDCPASEEKLEAYYKSNNISNEKNESGEAVQDESMALFRALKKFVEGLIDDRKAADFCIGHTYFMAKNLNELEYKVMYQVLPILREYAEDGIININGNVKVKDENNQEIDEPAKSVFLNLIEYLEGKKELTDELTEGKTVYKAIVDELKKYDPKKISQSKDTNNQ